VEDPNNPRFLLCGCPVGTENIADWLMQVTFACLGGIKRDTQHDGSTVGLSVTARLLRIETVAIPVFLIGADQGQQTR
jgi:hypothetical protein